MAEDGRLHKLSEHLVNTCEKLEFGIATGCRCLCCWTFQLRDTDNKVMHEAETLEVLIDGLSVSASTESK